MQQQTFTDVEYSRRKKKTRREEFLNMMDKIIPWNEWIDLIKPYYPSGKRGRPTRGIETMLRMYLMQNWFNLSDAAIEDTIYDSYAMRSFMHIDFYKEQVPTDLCGCQCASGEGRFDYARRNDRGCNDNQCTKLNKESKRQARS